MDKGDIVRWDFDLWTVGPKAGESELLETTNEALAKEKGIHVEGGHYGPRPMIVGAERLVKGLETSVLAAEVGKEVEVTIPPAEAHGDRDGKLIEVHSLNEVMRLPEFRKGDEEPLPGTRIVLNNKAGVIMSNRGGRVRIDFNHELAGKTLRYKYAVRARAEKPEERVQTVLELHYGRPGDFKVEVRGEECEVVLMEQCKYDPAWMLTKLQVVRDLREFAKMAKVRLVEEYVKPAPKPEKAEEHAHEHGEDHVHEHDEGHDHEHGEGHDAQAAPPAPKAEEAKAGPKKEGSEGTSGAPGSLVEEIAGEVDRELEKGKGA